MAVYAIGDIQGCYVELMALLETLEFDASNDQLWFTGDLVNRGPESLRVLRFVRDLNERTPSAAITVLGNHDLHLLAVAEGHGRQHRSDTLDEILAAPDREALLDWLRHQPLLHHDAALGTALGTTLIHAGLPPQWSLQEAKCCAAEVETALRGEDYRQFFAHMYGNQPDHWSGNLVGWDRLRFITNCFTRLRYCDANGRLAMKAKGAPGSQPAGYMPWFEVATRRTQDNRVVFGHWSTLGLYQGSNVVSLDTGCLWGGQLTAMRLDDEGSIHCVECSEYKHPGKK